MERTPLLDEVLGAELAEVRVLVEFSRVEVEQHVAQLVLNDVEGVYPARVACHRDEAVGGRGAESLRSLLDEIWSLIGSSFRDKLVIKKYIYIFTV